MKGFPFRFMWATIPFTEHLGRVVGAPLSYSEGTGSEIDVYVSHFLSQSRRPIGRVLKQTTADSSTSFN
jgi:hypothetical protein